MLISRKSTRATVFILLAGAGVAAWSLAPSSSLKPPEDVPRGYITLTRGDVRVTSTKLNPPDPGQACTVAAVNNSGKSVESVLLKFSTDAKLTFAGDTSGFGSTVGEFRASKPLAPGERLE